MNDDDDNMTFAIGHGAAASDTITITADDNSTIDLSDIKINASPFPNKFQWNGLGGGPGWASVIDSFKSTTETKNSVVYDLDIDPLAAIIEIKAEGRFPDIELIKRHIPSKETNEYAQTIREYFLDKVVTQKLSSTYRDTDFKRDMVKALKLSGKQVLEEHHIKLLYRMPDFYKEDIFLDTIVENNRSYPTNSRETLKNVSLTYIGSLDFYRRGYRAKNFYFKNSEGFVFLISSSNSTNLLPITKIFNQIKTMVVSGTANSSKLKGHDFNIITLEHKYNVEEFTF